MTDAEATDLRFTAVMKAVFEEIPQRLGVSNIVKDAHRRLMEAAEAAPSDAEREAAAQFISEKLVEVLQEIANYTVEQFTRRTGRPFLWVDEVEPEPDNIIMSFSIDSKGNVVF